MGPIHKRLSALLDDDKFNVVEFVSFFKQYPIEQIAEVVIAVIGEKLAGGPVDDRKLLIERMIQVVSSFPEESKARKKVTGVLVDKLWNSLDHPPTSYVGDLHQFRQADGSNNNPIYPELGKAGSPYARTVRTEVKGSGAKPDPGLLFDLLMSRESFEENQAGISSMLLYHASIITHDIFNTDRRDPTINHASSYLDLSPLYGSNKEDQDKVRLGRDGLLKSDTFSDSRLIAFPPGVSVMLVMYNRFHNSTARTLAAINEGGRFTPPRGLDPEEALKWKDEKLFQVARLVTNGLYVNISLHDYLRAIANVPATDSTWTLDPRVEVKKFLSKDGTPRGVGNQVSCEFNLLYRFHSAISDRDAKWTQEFYDRLPKPEGNSGCPISKFFTALEAYVKTIPSDPSVREFGGLKRGENGKFNDADLVKILKESIEDPAGRFGANHVPEIMKPIEIVGIIQARKWQVASLNEFRKYFELKPYETFKEINSDPYVADTLERLYNGDINQVELYPGMFLEDTKPKMVPGMGLCAPYSVTRAVFSDAITLVRGDRFLTLDYTPANLTNWGITEVESDLNFVGGAKMQHLILNSFSGFFKFNSIYAAQPFYTPTENKKIFERLKKADLFTFDPPAPEQPTIPITSHAALREVLSDQRNFRVPWDKVPSLKTYMLASDGPESNKQRSEVSSLMYGDVPTESFQFFANATKALTKELLDKKSYPLGRKGLRQVDIVADIGNLAALHFAADLFNLPLLSKSKPSCDEKELYKILTDITLYIFSDTDPTKSWARRHNANKGTAELIAKMEKVLKRRTPIKSGVGCPVGKSATPPPSPPADSSTGRFQPKTAIGRLGKTLVEGHSEITPPLTPTEEVIPQPKGIFSRLIFGHPDDGYPTPSALRKFGNDIASRLLGSGKSTTEVAQILVGTASAFVANTACAFAQLVDFYLQSENQVHWDKIKALAADDSPASDEILKKYILEGFRLSNTLGIFRDVNPVDGNEVRISQNGSTITAKKGYRIFANFIEACRDPTVFPSPNEVLLDRPEDAYITFGYGPHECLGKDLATVHTVAMVKVLAGLKNLRRTPGDEGKLNGITKPGGFKLYLTPDWSTLTPYPTTMKVMWDQ